MSVTTGITKSTTTTVQNKVTFTQSIEASMSGVIKEIGVEETSTMEFSTELEESLLETNEQNWSKTVTITFVIPAGKNIKVMQLAVKFDGELSWETCSLLTSIKIFESDGAVFEDSDNFIMSSVQWKLKTSDLRFIYLV